MRRIFTCKLRKLRAIFLLKSHSKAETGMCKVCLKTNSSVSGTINKGKRRFVYVLSGPASEGGRKRTV